MQLQKLTFRKVMSRHKGIKQGGDFIHITVLSSLVI